jgi:hypothetical protein
VKSTTVHIVRYVCTLHVHVHEHVCTYSVHVHVNRVCVVHVGLHVQYIHPSIEADPCLHSVQATALA